MCPLNYSDFSPQALGAAMTSSSVLVHANSKVIVHHAIKKLSHTDTYIHTCTYTAWCSEIGSLTSLMHETQVHLMTTENQFHCTRLYTHTHTHTHTRARAHARCHTCMHTHVHINKSNHAYVADSCFQQNQVDTSRFHRYGDIFLHFRRCSSSHIHDQMCQEDMLE